MTALPVQKTRIALAGGGTGGHVYPAIAVAERLRERDDVELVYFGSNHGVESEITANEGIPLRDVPAAQVRRGNPWLMAKGILRLWQGTRVARKHIKRERPAAVFATGGYVAAPVGRAASQAGVPLIVFLPDAAPGWAVRFLARYADTVACALDASVAALPAAKTVVTGYPLRRQFLQATRDEGIRRFDLDPSLPTILVTGGSLGAAAINEAVVAALPAWLEQAQVIHVAGRASYDALARRVDELPQALRSRYHLHAYTEEMAYAMAAADLAVARAGASTVGEMSVSKLPAIAVPGTFSDQSANAEYLATRGAGIHLPEGRIDELASLVLDLVRDTGRRQAMADAMAAIAKPDAAERLAALVLEAAGLEPTGTQRTQTQGGAA